MADWQVIDLSLQAYGKVGVSLYDTLGKDSAGASSAAQRRVARSHLSRLPSQSLCEHDLVPFHAQC